MIKPTIQAGLCLLALGILRRLDLAVGVSAVEVVRALGVARSTAYEHEARLRAQLEGDSTAEAASPPPDRGDAELVRLRIENAVLRYRLEHAGCWTDGGRTVYSDELRVFVVELAMREGVGERLTQEQFAQACGIPLPTFKPWWAAHRASSSAITDAQNVGVLAKAELTPEASTPESVERGAHSTTPTEDPSLLTSALAETEFHDVGTLHDDGVNGDAIASGGETEEPSPTAGFTLEMLRIVKEWENWHGTFVTFVREHLRNLGIRHGKKFVSDLLHLAAVRKLMRRPPPKPSARGSTFIPPPGIQWSSDGKEVVVVVDGESFTVAWQPMVDVGSTSTVGSTVRPTEDAVGVIVPFAEGIATTGDAPPVLLVDNKAPNKSAALKSALPDNTMLMHSTRGRAQNKATIEGSFGLFAQELGPVAAVVDATSPERIALSVAQAVTRAFSRGRNHRPRRKDGMTPYELYRDADPSPQEVAAAVDNLRAIKERIEAREQREAARRDPHVRATLEDACARFGLTEDGDVLDSLSTLPLETVQTAVAIYAAKHATGSLPTDAGLRYLAGIARNHHHARELQLFEEELVSQLEREQLNVMAHLERKAATLTSLDLAPRLGAIVYELLMIDVPLAQVFWRRQLTALATTVPSHLRTGLRRWLCERIARRFRATKQHRQQLIELVVRLLRPEPLPVSTAH
jgi:hypothetical protein